MVVLPRERAKSPGRDRGADGVGDLWTWAAIDADTKLVLTWHLGKHNPWRRRSIRWRSVRSDRVGARPNHNGRLRLVHRQFNDIRTSRRPRLRGQGLWPPGRRRAGTKIQPYGREARRADADLRHPRSKPYHDRACRTE